MLTQTPSKWGFLKPEEADELTHLLTLLRHASAGVWTIAICNNGLLRERLIEEIRIDLAPIPVRVEPLGRERDRLLPVLEAIPTQPTAPVVCLTDVEGAFPTLFRSLDLPREELARLPHRLILWVTEYGWRQLAEHAPNFYSRLSGIFRFEGYPTVSETQAP